MKDFKLDPFSIKETGFKVPENYFDDFSPKVMHLLPRNESKVLFLKKKNTWLFAAAAILVIGLCFTTFYKTTIAPAEIDSAYLENYLSTHSSFSEDEFVNLLDENDIKKINVSYAIEDQVVEEVLLQNANLEQYLIN